MFFSILRRPSFSSDDLFLLISLSHISLSDGIGVTGLLRRLPLVKSWHCDWLICVCFNRTATCVSPFCILQSMIHRAESFPPRGGTPHRTSGMKRCASEFPFRDLWTFIYQQLSQRVMSYFPITELQRSVLCRRVFWWFAFMERHLIFVFFLPGVWTVFM